MKRVITKVLQKPTVRRTDDDQQIAGLTSVAPSAQQYPLATVDDCDPVSRVAIQVVVPNQQDGAVSAKIAQHERRSAAARKAWITIRLNKAAAQDTTRPTSVVTPTGKVSGAFLATGSKNLEEQIQSQFPGQSSGDDERGSNGVTITASSDRTHDHVLSGESQSKPRKRRRGVEAKEHGTPLKRGAAVQIMTYPRPATKAVLVKAAREQNRSLSSFLILAGLEKAANLKECTLKDLIPKEELRQYV
jgi:hypothetical protein